MKAFYCYLTEKETLFREIATFFPYDNKAMDDKEFHELSSRIRDLSQKAASESCLTHTSFLSLSQQAYFYTLVKSMSRTINGVRYVLYGGHEEADRKILYFLPYYMKEEELLLQEEKGKNGTIALFHLSPKNVKFSDHLTHRDYLGALMHLGFDRSMFGDILTDGTEGYIYVLRSVAEMVKQELGKVSHTIIDVEELDLEQCPLQPRFEETNIHVAPARLDSVIAEVYHLSRRDAQILIASECVFVEGRTIENNAHLLKASERISVSGKGKFIYLGQEKVTRKNRLSVKVKRYG